VKEDSFHFGRWPIENLVGGLEKNDFDRVLKIWKSRLKIAEDHNKKQEKLFGGFTQGLRSN